MEAAKDDISKMAMAIASAGKNSKIMAMFVDDDCVHRKKRGVPQAWSASVLCV